MSKYRPILWLMFSIILLVWSFQFSIEHDYIIYKGQWEYFLEGNIPWGGASRNRYGPLHLLLAFAYDYHRLLPRAILIASWLLGSFALLELILKNHKTVARSALLALILFSPTFWVFTFRYGTNDSLVALLVVLGVYASRNAKDIWGGVSLGLATLLKVYPALLTPFFLLQGKKKGLQFCIGYCSCIILGIGSCYMLWGNSVFHPITFSTERHSKSLSIFRFLRGEHSPLHMIMENPNIDSWSVPLLFGLLCGALWLAIEKRTTLLTSLAGALLCIMLAYKVGHHQFYLPLHFVFVYWAITDGKHVRPLRLWTIASPLVLLALFSAIYPYTNWYMGNEYSWIRDIIGLPMFIALGIGLSSLVHTVLVQDSSSK